MPEQAKTFPMSLVESAMQHVPTDLSQKQGKAIFVLTTFGSLRMADVREASQSSVKVLTDLRPTASTPRLDSFYLLEAELAFIGS